MSNIKQWSITKNIAKIRLDLQTVLNDLEYQNSGGRILYGVDNDVIKLYSNPEEKRKYARSFDDENENSLITNAYSLAEYIFKYLSEEPLLTLPTLYTESTYIFEYIWNSASMAHAVKKHQLIILKNLFKNYQKTQDLNQLVEDMLDHCDDLCRYFSHDKSSSTDAEIELQRQAQELGLNFEQLAVQDRVSARDMQAQTKSIVPSLLAMLVTAGFFGILAALMLGYATKSDELMIMLGSLSSAWIGVISFYFGSSAGSQAKDQMIHNSTPTK